MIEEEALKAFDSLKSLSSKKIETLRLIKSKIVDETILDDLKTLEKLDRDLDDTTPAMDCTAAIIVGGGGVIRPEYLSAVDRRMIGQLEERGGDCKIVTGELKKCHEKIELSFHDLAVCAELCGSNTRDEALRLLQPYLKEEEERSVPDSVDNLAIQLDKDVDILPILALCAELSGSDTKNEALRLVHVYLKEVGDQSVPDSVKDLVIQPSSSFLQGDEKFVIQANIELPSETPRKEEEEEAQQKVQRSTVEKVVQTKNSENDVDFSAEPKPWSRKRISTAKPKRRRETQLILARRKTKRWSRLEENVLRDAVKRYGNSWKFILTLHSAELKGRTEVDLKDKWRNMKKYTTNP